MVLSDTRPSFQTAVQPTVGCRSRSESEERHDDRSQYLCSAVLMRLLPVRADLQKNGKPVQSIPAQIWKVACGPPWYRLTLGQASK